ncbi:DUF6506 family protein [Solicola gregarius]|uniref:DUF6506 family protein n=1 Tax=Solicola gregarius TaxID=2908642 RepID=A0AA46YLS1_9ACTN|nr:DUF6506 family protein [Solicola gregarius]UYM05879.1 DUF6506 family protein [Solicola gregarius]
MTTHVLFEGAPGVLVRTDELVVEGVGRAELIDAARRAAPAADRIELCGGIGVDDAASVIAVVGDSADVRLNRYGFESLEQVAAYKVAFGTGEVGDAAFFYATAQSTPLVQHEGVMVAGVADERVLIERTREAQARGAGIIELYGGLGARAAATVRQVTDDALPVGFID